MKNSVIDFLKSEKGKKITTGIIKGAAVVGIYAIAWVGIKTSVSVSNDCYDKTGEFVDKLVERNKAKKQPEAKKNDADRVDTDATPAIDEQFLDDNIDGEPVNLGKAADTSDNIVRE